MSSKSKGRKFLCACIPVYRRPTRVATKEVSGFSSLEGQLDRADPRSLSGQFSLKELQQATQNFSQKTILDDDCPGFTVYKGTLSSGEIIRVRRTRRGTSSSGDSPLDHFQQELQCLSGLSHTHIVDLAGYCLEENERLLVYECPPNGTLSDHLHDNPSSPLSLEKRLEIAASVASGLAHLHSHTSPPLVHYNLKSSSILLTDRFVPKISEFTLWKDVNNTRSESRVGYMAPEYFTMKKVTHKSDVYAFGVVLLELLTGQRSLYLDDNIKDKKLHLTHMLPKALDVGGWEAVRSRLDPFIREHPKQTKLLILVNLSLWCIEDDPATRPSMESIVDILKNLETLEL